MFIFIVQSLYFIRELYVFKQINHEYFIDDRFNLLFIQVGLIHSYVVPDTRVNEQELKIIYPFLLSLTKARIQYSRYFHDF